MSNNEYLESFPAWLGSLGEDARALADLLEGESTQEAQLWTLAALTYLFKSLDLIPDGLEELGFVDDAFVLRVAAGKVPEEERQSDASGTLTRLAAEAALIEQFLGAETYPMLVQYVERLATGAARGRTVDELTQSAELRAEFASQIRHWASDYAEPSFLRDEKNLVKLRAFLGSKLK